MRNESSIVRLRRGAIFPPGRERRQARRVPSGRPPTGLPPASRRKAAPQLAGSPPIEVPKSAVCNARTQAEGNLSPAVGSQRSEFRRQSDAMLDRTQSSPFLQRGCAPRRLLVSRMAFWRSRAAGATPFVPPPSQRPCPERGLTAPLPPDRAGPAAASGRALERAPLDALASRCVAGRCCCWPLRRPRGKQHSS